METRTQDQRNQIPRLQKDASRVCLSLSRNSGIKDVSVFWIFRVSCKLSFLIVHVGAILSHPLHLLRKALYMCHSFNSTQCPSEFTASISPILQMKQQSLEKLNNTPVLSELITSQLRYEPRCLVPEPVISGTKLCYFLED